ncbi:hypothetical protein RFI_09132 [Reticulomyxa filosa]|uniref:Uncharacterized protein n=1 Tax=Reticulomyxa filosa TaxID=46433 RepID=X6NNZ9_RETFI|nr:hypothetical protein RFI_09132 [Reticulomyxa filosa]|eukprot:ETO28000.1 hypothetical protein RFI_09132 [Reticulomyxa filosa]
MKVRVFVFRTNICETGELVVNCEKSCFEITFLHQQVTHVLFVNWDSIVGLDRIPVKTHAATNLVTSLHCNTECNREHQESNNGPKNSNYVQFSNLKEQLIIELKQRPTVVSSEQSSIITKKEYKHSIASYYIGIEYSIDDAWYLLNTLLNFNPCYYEYLNHKLPSFIWIPYLTHHFRVWIENIILFSNVCLFFWTIYQLCKYTNVMYSIYRFFKPWIFEPFLIQYNHSSVFQEMCNYWHQKFQMLQPLISQGIITKNIFQFAMKGKNLFHSIWSITQQIMTNISDILKQSWFYESVFFIYLQCKECFLYFRNALSFDWTYLNLNCKWTNSCFQKWLHHYFQSKDSSLKTLTQVFSQCNPNANHFAAVELVKITNTTIMNSFENSKIGNRFESFTQSTNNTLEWSWLRIGKPLKHIYDFVQYWSGRVGEFGRHLLHKFSKVKKEILITIDRLYLKKNGGVVVKVCNLIKYLVNIFYLTVINFSSCAKEFCENAISFSIDKQEKNIIY